jgi:UDP-2,3-diacylglucosamine hydrolase
MDVTLDAVDGIMRKHSVRHLIHGHTHRPAIHNFMLDDQEATRIVLGDWYEQDSVLIWDEAGYRLGRIADL